MIEFQCTSCNQRINANDQYAGKPCNCPNCEARNTIPTIMDIPPGPDPDAPLSSKLQLNTQYAGFWKRFCAILIDVTIIAIVGGIISSIACAIIKVRLLVSGTDPMIIPYISMCVGLTINSIFQLLYFTILQSSALQATLGKMALGIIVTDETGNRISFMRANGRLFAKSLSELTLGIGFIMAGFTERKQALHDMIASTYVINKPR